MNLDANAVQLFCAVLGAVLAYMFGRFQHKKEYKEKSISNDLEQLIENRESKPFKDSKLVPLHKDDAMEYTHQIIMPIVSSSGDCIGSIVLISKESEMLSEGDEKILKIAANFLGKQVQ